MNIARKILLVLSVVSLPLTSLVFAASGPGPGWGGGYLPGHLPGFILLAKHRFDPAVQRLMAERSLRALPLRDGQLYYVYPTNIDPRVEQAQIRYLEYLLDKRAIDEPETDKQ